MKVVVVVVAAAVPPVVTSCANHCCKVVQNFFHLSWNSEFLSLLNYRRMQDISLRKQYSLSGLYHVTCQKTPFVMATTVTFSTSHNFTIIMVKSLTSWIHSTPTNTIYLNTVQYHYYTLSRPTYSQLTTSFKCSKYNLNLFGCPYVLLRSPCPLSLTFIAKATNYEFLYYVNRRISTVSTDLIYWNKGRGNFVAF